MPKSIKIILGLILGTSLGLNLFLSQQLKQSKDTFLVTEIIDGDSFIIAPDHTVRLADIELDTGEQWLCNEKQARLAGYTKSQHLTIYRF